jgi:hypothetical protein
MLLEKFKVSLIKLDTPTPWGYFFQDSATPQMWSGKSLTGYKQPNSGNPLKLRIPSHSRKAVGGWINYSCKVTSHKMKETEMGYRGSKSVICESIAVKEQRVYGSWWGILSSNNVSHLRCILTGFERNYQVKIPSNQIVIRYRCYSTTKCNSRLNIKHNLNLDPSGVLRLGRGPAELDPNFITGFTDGEGCFTLSITKSNQIRTSWAIKPRFQINLHKKDLQLLESIQSYFCCGHISKTGSKSYQLRIDSIKDIQVIIDHFDKYPLITQKFGDYQLFKQAYVLWLNKEYLTYQGLRKIVAIKATMNNGLSERLKAAFPDLIPVLRPYKEDIKINDPQWLAGFVSGEGYVMVRIKNSKTSSKAIIELVFQINQHIRDVQLITYIAKYLNCGKIYKHSKNAVVFRVSKLSDINQNIISFFSKYHILGVKAKDFKDFCFIASILNKKGHLTKDGLDLISQIKAKMNTKRNLED